VKYTIQGMDRGRLGKGRVVRRMQDKQDMFRRAPLGLG